MICQKGSDVSSSLQKKTKKLFIFSNNLNLRVLESQGLVSK